MKVELDADVCGGHGVCVELCPDVFALTDAGYGVVLVDAVPSGLVDLVQMAVAQCPTRALTITEDAAE